MPPEPGRASWSSELLFTRESLQSTVEELQTANEELKSSNEELQSTNEELQSTNEELETSKEEMQSLNEELQTVNTQLQSKVEALSQTNDDMQNLLNSTAIATVFLDGQLRIRRFTEAASKVFNLIPGDVGRPLADLVSQPQLRTVGGQRRRGAAHPGGAGEGSADPGRRLAAGAHPALSHDGQRD